MENDPLCGITTGGNENCEWDCEPFYFATPLYYNPECFIDCFEEGHCARKILNDYINANGICFNSFNEVFGDILPRTNNTNCQTTTINGVTYTTDGIFSDDTLASIYENETCIFDIHRKSVSLFNTVTYIVYTSSDIQAYRYWAYFVGRYLNGVSDSMVTDTLPPLIRLNPNLR